MAAADLIRRGYSATNKLITHGYGASEPEPPATFDPPFASGLVNLQRGGSLVTSGQRGGSLVDTERE